MKTEQGYVKDLTEIRSMMERSTRFLSLTGLSGIMAGLYALAGAFIAWKYIDFNPDPVIHNITYKKVITGDIISMALLAIIILVLAIGTAVFFSSRKSREKGEKLWNSVARRLVINMAIPLATGGILILVLISKGLLGLIAPITLIFYGLALLNASKFTYEDFKYLGITEIVIGLFAAYFSEFGLIFWAIGFGFIHIIYGIYMHLRYEK